MAKNWKIEIVEYERGWGSKVDESVYFDTEQEAIKFRRDYNDKYNPPMDRAPEWYMIAMGPYKI